MIILDSDVMIDLFRQHPPAVAWLNSLGAVVMAIIVRTRIIKIGNSQGVRIPKLLLNQTDLGEEVELELQQNQIVIRSAHQARANWEDQFRAMAEWKDDKLLNGEVMLTTTWDEDEWEW